MAVEKKPFPIEVRHFHRFYEAILLSGDFTIQFFVGPEKRTQDEIIEAIPRPALSNIETLVACLKNYIKQKQEKELLQMLQSDFVLRDVNEKTSHEVVITDKVIGEEWEKHIKYYTNALFEVRPNIEELLLNHRAQFIELLELAETADQDQRSQMRHTLLKSLQYIKLAAHESINFDGMKLAGAIISGAELGSSIITETTLLTDVDFSNCNLEHVKLETNLDRCKTYANAKLPATCHWQFWTMTTRKKILAQLCYLYAHAYNKIDGSEDKIKKVDCVENLYSKYQILLRDERNIKEAQKEEILEELSRAKKILAVHRNCNYIVAEAAAAFLLLGIFYVIGISINYYRTGRLGLFTQPHSAKIVDKLQSLIEDTKHHHFVLS